MPQPPLKSPSQHKMQIFREVMVQGEPRPQVARRHKLTLATVSRYVGDVQRYLAVQMTTLESALIGNVHLERLEHQWFESMQAWSRSKQDQVIKKASTDHQGRQRAEQICKTSSGDPRFLEQGRRALADIRSLLALDHLPTEQELLDDAPLLTLEQRMALLDRLLQTIGDSAAVAADVPTDSGPTDAGASPADNAARPSA